MWHDFSHRPERCRYYRRRSHASPHHFRFRCDVTRRRRHRPLHDAFCRNIRRPFATGAWTIYSVCYWRHTVGSLIEARAFTSGTLWSEVIGLECTRGCLVLMDFYCSILAHCPAVDCWLSQYGWFHSPKMCPVPSAPAPPLSFPSPYGLFPSLRPFLRPKSSKLLQLQQKYNSQSIHVWTRNDGLLWTFQLLFIFARSFIPSLNCVCLSGNPTFLLS